MNEFSKDLIIKPCELFLSSSGQLKIERPNFNPTDSSIHMDERVDDDEYSEMFKHECGHFIDHKLGFPSCKEQFKFALQADLDQYTSKSFGMETLNQMLNELVGSLARENRNLSDIFSALFYENTTSEQKNRITEIYNNLGIPIYGHKPEYWSGEKGPENAVYVEAFADMCAIFSENNLETIEFVDRWLPNLSRRFKKEISEKRKSDG